VACLARDPCLHLSVRHLRARAPPAPALVRRGDVRGRAREDTFKDTPPAAKEREVVRRGTASAGASRSASRRASRASPATRPAHESPSGSAAPSAGRASSSHACANGRGSGAAIGAQSSCMPPPVLLSSALKRTCTARGRGRCKGRGRGRSGGARKAQDRRPRREAMVGVAATTDDTPSAGTVGRGGGKGPWTSRVQLVRRDGRDVSTLYGREGRGREGGRGAAGRTVTGNSSGRISSASHVHGRAAPESQTCAPRAAKVNGNRK